MVHIKNPKNSGIHISDGGGIKEHNKLKNLDFEHSGHTGFQEELTFDEYPTENSNNPVKSGGVKSSLGSKQDKNDNTLKTTSKNVVGAINELNDGKLDYEIGYEDEIDSYCDGNESFCVLYKISEFSSDYDGEFYDVMPYYLIASYNADTPYGASGKRQIKIQDGDIFYRHYVILPGAGNSHWSDWSTSYTKPQTGIPENDLSEGVQTKLNNDLAKRLAMYGKDVTPTNSSNFDWTLINNNTEYRIKPKSGVTLTGDIVIPYEHNGKPVTQLWQGLFKNQIGITSITIPNSITSMSSTYNGGIFQGCTGITSIIMPDSIKQTDVYSDARYLFYGCTNLKSVHMGKNIEYLGACAFNGCSSLEVVEIPDGVLGVGINVNGAVNELTFANCPNLKKVIIPDSVTAFGTSLFKYSPNIVVYCNKGSAAESYCKTYNVPYTYNDFKDKQDIDKRKLKLYYHFIAGYSVLTAEPSDWATNYTNYYTLYGTSTSEDMAYIPVTGEEAPTFVKNQYYRKATGATVDTTWFYFPNITDEAVINFTSINTGGSTSGVTFLDENGKRVFVPMSSDGLMYIKIARGWLYGYGTASSKQDGTYAARIGEFGTSTNRWLGNVGARTVKVDGHIKIYTPQTVSAQFSTLTTTIIDGKTYYQIGTADDYAEFVTMANADLTINGILTADIDLSDWTGVSIGKFDSQNSNNSSFYSGIFDGNGHVIKNLSISRNYTSNKDAAIAMFNIAKGATIKNLGVENATITNTGTANGVLLAVLVGRGYYTTIENCYVKNSSILSTAKDNYIQAGGPIAAVALSETVVKNCYSVGNTIGFSESGGKASGGVSIAHFIGYVGTAFTASNIESCYAKGNQFINLPSGQKRTGFARLGSSGQTNVAWLHSYTDKLTNFDEDSTMTKYATDAATWSNGTVLAGLNSVETAWKADTNNVNGGAPRLLWETDVYIATIH